MKDTSDTPRTTGPAAAPSPTAPAHSLAGDRATLAVVCDAPTRAGFDPGERDAGAFGREGVALAHLGDVRRLFDGVPLDRVRLALPGGLTGMWLLALCLVAAEERGLAPDELHGTTHEERPEATALALRLRGDLTAYVSASLPRWAFRPGTLPGGGSRSAWPGDEAAAVAALARWRQTREESTDRQGLADPYLWPSVRQSLDRLADAALGGDCLMDATLDCVRAGVTTGEWARTLRAALGAYEAPAAPAASAGHGAPATSRARRRPAPAGVR
ncbi:methylmalonyl-CoA mutase family protein [Streptomyces sp. NPDC004959]|uniref:methylmalonyl-CoA mutase family protein n=1 Tax=Streptomyces sp. NPDC004959 TaxID=3154673 RepID=UPI0033A098BB